MMPLRWDAAVEVVFRCSILESLRCIKGQERFHQLPELAAAKNYWPAKFIIGMLKTTQICSPILRDTYRGHLRGCNSLRPFKANTY